MRGDVLLVGLTHPDLETNTYRGGVHKVSPDGGSAPWTYGHRDTSPVISPDGRWVAFLRVAAGPGDTKPGDPGSAPQLYLMPGHGGEARRITEAPLGVAMPVWAPDSRRIAYVARVPEPGRYGTPAEPGADAPSAAAEAPRRITRLDYRLDDLGFRLDRTTRLYVVNAVDALNPALGVRPVELTDGRTDVSFPCWTSDGQHLVFAAERDLGERETEHSDLYAVPAGGGEVELVVRSAGEATRPTASGAEVYFLSAEFEGIDVVAHNRGLWVAPLRIGGEPGRPRRLTDVETVDCDPASGAPVVTGDGVLVAVRNRGAVELRRVALAAEAATLAETTLVLGEHAAVTGFAVDGRRIVAAVSTPDSPGEVVLHEHGTTRVLTDFAAPLRTAGLRPPRELTGRSRDGYEAHGWLVLPKGPGPHPVVLHVHGGPFMYHGWGFFDEAQVYAAAGYAVVLGNPRGSAGYGERHGRAIIGAFGTVDVDDLLAVLDAALGRPECDQSRVGVMGGSYGGFMTGWLAAHHGDRFLAGWSERACNAFDSFTGSSDIGYLYTDAYLGTDPEAHAKMSPLTYADRIRMPFAIVHSEQDLRCPVEQAQRMFVALKRRGVETEMLIFPGEGHELTRSGRPVHRKQRFDAVLDWWSRHLDGSKRLAS